MGELHDDKTSNITDANDTARDTDTDGKGGKQATSADVSHLSRRQTHDRPPALEKKIGKTTYRVGVHFSKTSRETLEDKIHRMLREDVRRAMQSAG